jgi:microcystin-dependent protein
MDKLQMFSGGFPLNIERLQFLQNTYTKGINELSTIFGTQNIIVSGLEIDDSTQPSTLSTGVVSINGEIMAFRASDESDNISIFEEVLQVAYNEDLDGDNNGDIKPADTLRYAQSGTGGVATFLYSSFTRLSSLVEMMPRVGDMKMINRAYSDTTDKGWLLCDGQNNTPDMRARFPMGASQLNDIAVGDIGGANEVSLSLAQSPEHSHSGTTNSAGNHSHTGITIKGSSASNSQVGQYITTSNETPNGDQNNAAETSVAGAHTHSFITDSKGSGEAHENRPAFYAINYIIYVGI